MTRGGYDLDDSDDGIPVALARLVTAEGRARDRAPLEAALERRRLTRARRRREFADRVLAAWHIAREQQAQAHARYYARRVVTCVVCDTARPRAEMRRVLWAHVCRGPCNETTTKEET